MSDTTSARKPPTLLALADFITVGAPPPTGVPGAAQATAADHFGQAQPGQLWVFRPDSPLDRHEHREQVSAAGGTIAHADSDETLVAVVLGHALDLLSTQRKAQKEMARELTTLRRELNRALSALSVRHPILGLLETRPPDDHRPFPYVQWPADPGRSDRSAVPFEPTRYGEQVPAMSRAAMWAEMRRLYTALESFEQTKIIRWTRPLRRLYARLTRRNRAERNGR